MKMVAKIMDDRFSGVALTSHAPVVVPIRARYKWAFWRKPVMLWGVVQPKREFVGGSIELVWRHIAIFKDKPSADAFLLELPIEATEHSK